MNNALVSSRSVSSSLVGKILGAGGFTILLCFSAYVKIPLPFTPVPVTLQNLVVVLAGAVLGPSLGVASVAGYLLLGAVGTPLFANSGAGLAYLAGPTGGYLWGFLLAAWTVGAMVRSCKKKNVLLIGIVMAIGMLVIYAAGAFWLSVGFRWPMDKIILLGVLPFVGADMAKVLIGAVVYQRSRR
ncbi:MAG: biotin transporter BioY [Candidatus Omnitrophota bacterium]